MRIGLAIAVGMAAAIPTLAVADPDPPTVIPSYTKSPDGVLGVLVYADAEHADHHHNQIVEIATGRVVATFASEAIFLHESHADPAPRWSEDGSLLVWYVDGKWGSHSLEVIKLDDPHHHPTVRWQTDVREGAVAQSLAAMKRARPDGYAAAKAHAKGWGSWYRDGFSIDVRAGGAKIETPLAIAIELTTNVKGDRDFPPEADLHATMTATLKPDGALEVGALNVK